MGQSRGSLHEYQYEYKDINWDDLARLKQAIEEDAGHSVRPYEIRPFRKKPAFKDVWGPKFPEFEELFKNHQRQIRKFGLEFWRVYGPHKNVNRIILVFRVKENADQVLPSYNYPSIILSNWEAQDTDFEKVRRVVENVLKIALPLLPPPDPKEELLVRYDASIRHPELRRQTCSAMRGHHYDLALSGAAILVESALKRACLKYGCNKAKFATGAELAQLAYHPTSGCMTPPYPLAAEANEGAFQLLRGFFFYLRNAYLHNATVMGDDRRYVVELLALCEALLMIIEGSTLRK